jgi:putative ABC transport system substrate-binding protein
VKAGGLMSYGADEDEQWRRTAIIADKIFKGAKPADSDGAADEVQARHRPQDGEGLGLTLPPSLLVRADELIP